MKKIIFLIFIVMSVSCKKETVSIDALSKNINFKNGFMYYENSLFSGVVIDHYENSNLKSQKSYLKGRLHGLSILWYPSEIMYSERIYKNGLKTGVHKGWWDSGTIKFEYHFNKRGEHHGIAYDYFLDGSPYRLFHYENGKEEGSQKMYTKRGSLRANYVVVDGEKFGLIGLKKCDAVSTMY